MFPKVHIIDYGLGNLFSVENALKKIGADPIIVMTPAELMEADYIILPGVGSFQKGMEELQKRGFPEAIFNHVKKGKKLLGICLGMQMLLDDSEEEGFSKGLGLIPGTVKKIKSDSKEIKVPHMGWSKLVQQNQLDRDDNYMYFVHSYHCITDQEHSIATTTYYDCTINAVVKNRTVWGAQFHPEKSGEHGLVFLKKWLSITGNN